MRLYALLFAVLVLRARAATIPDVEAEKKLPEVDAGKTENTASEQELVDQTNTIKDVENNLRVKPADDIPVAVIVENPEAILKISEESDDIERPEPDLNNPGPPQRQLHETQNPEYHGAEQQSVLSFKQSVNDAQALLRQGFKGVSDGIRHIYDSGDQIKTVQQTIHALRNGFALQVNKLNDTIQKLLNPENPNNAKPANEESKANFRRIEIGLNTLKNDFTVGVKTLADGVDVVASLKADNSGDFYPENTDGAAVDPPDAPTNLLIQYLGMLHDTVTAGFTNLTNAVMSQAQGPSGESSQISQSGATGVGISNTLGGSAAIQADVPVTPQLNPFQASIQNIQNTFNNLFNNSQPAGGQGSGPFAPITNLGNQIQSQINQFLNPSANGSQTPASGQTSGGLGSGNNPIVTAIQNNPIVSGLMNLFQQNRPGAQPAPAPAPASTAAPSQEAATQAPAAPAKLAIEKQKDADITDITDISMEPVEAMEEKKPEDEKKVEDEKEDEGSSKFGFDLHNHHHGSGGSGDNINISGSGVDKVPEADNEVPKEPIKEVVPEEPTKEDKVDDKPEQTENKTE